MLANLSLAIQQKQAWQLYIDKQKQGFINFSDFKQISSSILPTLTIDQFTAFQKLYVSNSLINIQTLANNLKIKEGSLIADKSLVPKEEMEQSKQLILKLSKD